MSVASEGKLKGKTIITDPTTGDDANLTNNALDVALQDQHTRTGDLYFSQVVGVSSTLTTAAAIDDYVIAVSAAHGIVADDQLVIYDTASARLYIGDVLSVATNDITLDSPINFAYPTATTVIVRSTKDINVDGSVTRQVFEIRPPTDVTIDITRIMFQITTTDYPELDMFGDIAGGLTRGLVLRVVNGINVNYFNVKTNGELVNLMYDVNFYEAAKQGVNGLGGRLTYAGPSKHGVTIRLAQDDALQIIVSDDLTALLSARIIGTFHIVE